MKTLESLLESLRRYLQITFGESPTFFPWSDSHMVPLYLQGIYSWYIAEFGGHPSLLAIDLGETKRTPAQIKNDFNKVSERWGTAIIYVSDILSSANRFRLVTAKVAFIIPGKQLYLPPLAIDFREVYKKVSHPIEKLSPAAQAVVLQKLLRDEPIQFTASELASRNQYSKMTMGRVFDELETIGIAYRKHIGKEKRLCFTKEKRELWNAVLPFLSSPIKKYIYIHAPSKMLSTLPVTGESALALYSNLNPPAVASFAVKTGSIAAKELLQYQIDAQVEEEGNSKIEFWSYDPNLLSSQGAVDILSLFLTLQASTDERIRKALSEMMELLQWR